jgi:uncharacterized protein
MSASGLRNYQPFRNTAAKKANPALVAEARAVAAQIARELMIRFGATRVVLFGSLIREDFSALSDIDLAVWGVPPPDYYRAVAFASGFSKTWKVNLLDPEDCSPSLRQHIVQEGIEL